MTYIEWRSRIAPKDHVDVPLANCVCQNRDHVNLVVVKEHANVLIPNVIVRTRVPNPDVVSPLNMDDNFVCIFYNIYFFIEDKCRLKNQVNHS